jgi:hypothetical protein
VAFDTLRGDELAAHAEVWEAAILKLEAGLMPPPGEPRPEAVELERVADWLVASLDDAARERPNPGAPVLHR